MENQHTGKNGTISLPDQVLDLGKIKMKKIRRLILQFEVSVTARNEKNFQLVAYPLYKKRGEWIIGEKTSLELKKDGGMAQLPLPLTLGNLEIDFKKIKKCIKTGKEVFTLRAYHYDKNPHAAYTMLDESGQSVASANPCPPGRPLSD
jgi:hypothetical protein